MKIKIVALLLSASAIVMSAPAQSPEAAAEKIYRADLARNKFIEANFKFRYPQRFTGIEGHGVNLMPLFQWWVLSTTQKTNLPVKPLKMWCHITGKITASVPTGWLVDAEIEYEPGSPRLQTIFLRRPPKQERMQFLQLVDLRDQSSESASRLYAASEANASNASYYRGQYESYQYAVNAVPSDPLGYRVDAQNNLAWAQAAERFAQQQRQRSEAAHITSGQAADRINSSFPFTSDYKVDTFAECLFANELGAQVYDAGLGFK